MIPLCTHSHYSLMQGVPSPEELVMDARRKGYRQLALTDTGNLYGLWSFLEACRQHRIKPIIGAELEELSAPGAPPGSSRERMVCLVKDRQGFSNLCRLLTLHHRARSCRADQRVFSLREKLADLGQGLIVLSPAPATLHHLHQRGVHCAAVLHRRPAGNTMELTSTASRLEIPLVASPGSYFLAEPDWEVHQVLRAISHNTTRCRLSPHQTVSPDCWLATPAQYAQRFQILPQAIRGTHLIAEQCNLSLPTGELVLPPWTEGDPCPPPTIPGSPAALAASPPEGGARHALRKAAFQGARSRYGDPLPPPVITRLEKELCIIGQKGFVSYFLVVQNIVQRSPRICGRGSGAASLVAYSLGITNVCPIKHNLYFERFLNVERVDPPDIDVDFAWDERDQVLESVLSQYRGQAAMVCNHVTFGERMALRETAKVFGMPADEINHAIRYSTRTGVWSSIRTVAGKLVGRPRLLSVHPGGVVITPGPVDRFAPVETAPKGVPILQWEKDGTEEAGLVKIDLLGNRSLGVIRDTVANIRGNDGQFYEENWEPEDDPDTMDAIAKGHTMGCFYIESPAMRLLQRKSGVGDFAHVVIHSSIIRPAANEFVREYIRRLHGGRWEPLHPLLEETLAETYGIMVYQEDVSRVAVALAGFSHGEADALRKVLSKRDRERRLTDYRERFMEGTRTQGLAHDKAMAIWDMMMSFDGYSFCKAHSASYARVSFQAAYLKVHHPAEFMAAVISNMGGFYSTFAYVSEAKRMGLTILPPDINASGRQWRGRGDRVRVGLMAVKGLEGETMDRIVAARQDGGAPFRDVADLLCRVQIDGEEARALIHAGALDSLAPGADGQLVDRRRLLWALAHHRHAQERRKGVERPEGCRPLWSEAQGATAQASPAPLPPLTEGSRLDALRQEYRTLGFLCRLHPLDLIERPDPLSSAPLIQIRDLEKHVGHNVRLLAWLLTGKPVRTKQGERMEFLSFEDQTGIAEATLFPVSHQRYGHLLDRCRPFLLEGRVEEDFGATTLTISRLETPAR